MCIMEDGNKYAVRKLQKKGWMVYEVNRMAHDNNLMEKSNMLMKW